MEALKLNAFPEMGRLTCMLAIPQMHFLPLPPVPTLIRESRRPNSRVIFADLPAPPLAVPVAMKLPRLVTVEVGEKLVSAPAAEPTAMAVFRLEVVGEQVQNERLSLLLG